MRSLRPSLLIALGLFGLGLVACFGHHTSDELVLERATPAEDDDKRPIVEEDDDEPSDEGDRGRADAGGNRADGGVADAGMQCTQADIFERLICSAGLGGAGGGIEGIIEGLLGGGMSTANCARETDPIARLLCEAAGAGGGGIEGIIGGLLGGGRDGGAGVLDGLGSLLGDGGIERVLVTTLVEVVRGLIDDLIGSFFGAGRDGGTARTGVSGRTSRLVSSEELTRSARECAQVAREDLLTRLICARAALDAIDASLPAE